MSAGRVCECPREIFVQVGVDRTGQVSGIVIFSACVGFHQIEPDVDYGPARLSQVTLETSWRDKGLE